jgi:hypothetical protein
LCRCIFNIFDDSFDYPLHVGTVEREDCAWQSKK